MSSAVDIHPLVAAVRARMAADDELTQQQVADGIGVSVRTVQNWLLTDTTPQKRHRPLIRQWLENGVSA